MAVELGPGEVDLSAVKAGQTVWKTDDPAIRREIEKSYARQEVHRRVRVDLDVIAQPGQRLEVTWRDEHGHAVAVKSPMPLAEARTSPLSVEMLKAQLGPVGRDAI